MKSEVGLGEDKPIRGGKKIAEWLDMDERTVRNWCQNGIIPAEKFGKTWITTPRKLRERFSR